MITQQELTAVELSPTKKDFYQIWNELLETAAKLSERWDPASTNESDPGIVLLKVLTAVADKLNFTIDANTLEAFMPSAAQEESMRKLTEMLGYDMKYYQSATVDVKISYNGTNKDAIPNMLLIDKFTNIKDIDDSINYVTLSDVYLSTHGSSKVVSCIEGELVECETDDNNIISMMQLDDNHRYYLPETQIAENGIFIINVTDGVESDPWKKVTNLNVQNIGSKVYKFGYDSKEGLPYIQFPEDISTIIEDGLKIKYLRTKGINGNVSVNTLCKMEQPASWSAAKSAEGSAENDKDYYNVDNYTVTNISASSNGTDIESINDAYNSYKKTIGTFDTLITCRDYMNKIYQMTTDDVSTTPLVSNVIVSDIRDDINKAMTLCTFTERGIEYKAMAKPIDTHDAITITESRYSELQPTEELLGNLYKVVDNTDLTRIRFYARCIFNGNLFMLVKVNDTELTHFDLVLYPFRNTYGLNSRVEYVKSFKYDDSNLLEIKDNLETNKTLSHNFIDPNLDDIACIKNYLKLKAKITTVRKVGALEQAEILGKVYTEVYKNFNLRKLDFGEEIPYESILDVITNADPRIKNVSLEEPELATKFCTVGGGEYETSTNSNKSDPASIAFATAGDKYFNKLVLNNVLAGRVPLFNYDENFKPDYNEVQYPGWQEGSGSSATTKTYSLIYPAAEDSGRSAAEQRPIYSLSSEFLIKAGAKNIKLNDNEVVQFRLPNLKTVKTYPAYVNYYISLNDNAKSIPAIPATFQTLLRFMEDGYPDDDHKKTSWERYINSGLGSVMTEFAPGEITSDNFGDKKSKYHAIFTYSNNRYTYLKEFTTATKYYYAKLDATTVFTWDSWIRSLINTETATNLVTSDALDTNESGVATPRTPLNGISRNGLYVKISTSKSNKFGALVDNQHTKYKLFDRPLSAASDVDLFTTGYYVQRLWSVRKYDSAETELPPETTNHTTDGLGQNSEYVGITANEEYTLKAGEYLLINYTQSSNEDGTEQKTKINKFYGPTTIIKPNFELIDSKKYSKSHNYTKKDGYSFLEYDKSPDGLFTLGANEQIEIRDFVQVNLDEISTNIYWERNDEIPDYRNRIIFEFTEEPVYFTDNTYKTKSDTPTEYVIYTAYTLKDGEYFYYTDQNKNDIAYYGSGTKIKKTVYTPTIYKFASDNDISTDEIASNGLNAAIPWRAFDFSKSGTQDKKLVITEYQYINLTKGNILNSITALNSTSNEEEQIERALDNEFRDIKSATYTILTDPEDEDSGKSSSLPVVNFDTNTHWQVRTKLEFNASQTTVQTLHSTEDTQDSITLWHKNDTDPIVLTPHNNVPLSIKLNKLIQSSRDKVDVTTKKFAEDGHLEEEIPDLQLKVLQIADIRDDNGNAVSLNNFGDSFTKLSFNDVINNGDAAMTTLNAVIPSDCYGLVMFYNVKVNASTDAAAIRFIKSNPADATIPQVKIFNHWNPNNTVPSGVPVSADAAKGWWGTADTGKINPDNYGKIYTKKTWAVRAQPFAPVTEDEYNRMKNEGNLYRETEISVSPTAKPLYRYDSTNKKYYKYTKVEQDTVWSESAIYGHLTSATAAPAVESDEFEILDKVTFESLRNTDLYRRVEADVSADIEIRADERYDYDTHRLYQYSSYVNTAWSSSFSDYSFGQLLDHGGDTVLYQLREGINIVQLDSSCKIEIYPDNLIADTVILSSLDIIKKANALTGVSAINKKLAYKKIDKATVDEQILSDINYLDIYQQFYYNNVISNSSSIDMNIKDDEDTMEYPINWYDRNNINNKFVVSEIDAEEMIKNVVISKASRS